MNRPCLDSSAWIEIFHNGANAKAFVNALGDPTCVIVSTISLYEVWKYTAQHADEHRAQRLIEAMQLGVVVDVDPTIAIQAAALSLQHKIAMADGLIYATARSHNATLWTQDDDFQHLPHVKYFPKRKT
jgi:predicted nucleic acid-binding protein